MPELLRLFLFTLLLFLFKQAAFAQHWQWATRAGGSGPTSGTTSGFGIAADTNGNSYVTGYFEGTATFGTVTLISAGNQDIFIAKFDPTGKVVWARSAGGPLEDRGFRVTVDVNDRVYVTGRMDGTGFLGENSDIFVSKYDADGSLLWTQKAGGPGTDNGSNIAVDATGNSYISGRFQETATFGAITVTGSSLYSNFIAKYSPAGQVIWVKSTSGTAEFFRHGIDLDAVGNIYFTGSFTSTATFDNITLTADGLDDLFIAKYNPEGNVIWAKRAGGSRFEFSSGLAVDADGNSYITGTFYSKTATFDAITITNNDNSSGLASDKFVAKYNAAGKAVWAKQAGGPGFENATDIAVDASGNSYIAGYFTGSITFGTTTLTGGQNQFIFIAKYTPAGEVAWAKQAGNPAASSGLGIAVDAQGNGYVTGAFFNVAAFDNFKITSTGRGGDAFIAKFGSTPVPDNPVVAEVFIPNIITPNSDGINDTFAPRIPGQAADLKIYNRWGVLVYKQANYQNTWNGGNLRSGTYYYALTTAAGESWKGWLEINR